MDPTCIWRKNLETINLSSCFLNSRFENRGYLVSSLLFGTLQHYENIYVVVSCIAGQVDAFFRGKFF